MNAYWGRLVKIWAEGLLVLVERSVNMHGACLESTFTTAHL